MTPEVLYSLTEATWPPAEVRQIGPVTVRRGDGAGSRVSAATVRGPVTTAEIAAAERAMADLDQPALWMIRVGDDALDAQLAARGYAIKDPVVGYAAPAARLARQRPPPVTTFEVWPPLAAQAEIWAAGGIGPARLAVMDRVRGPKTSILGRLEDTPAGCAFAACHGDAAMVHAIEVAARFRRKGLGRHMLTACAFWAVAREIETLALLVTRANAVARGLYASLGMEPVGEYHYRIRTEPADGQG